MAEMRALNRLYDGGAAGSAQNDGPGSTEPGGRRVIRYTDERHDDFAAVQKPPLPIGKDFPFLHRNPIWNLLAWFVYRMIMTPFAFLYCKIRYRLKIVRHTTRRPKRGEGCFLYANHTLNDGDAFIPTVEMFPKRVYTVVSPANLATRGTRNFLQMNGALPLPQGASAFRYFLNAVEKRILQGNCVAVYPEAHVWPYYTGIRDFPPAALRYPVRYGAPVYVSTTTFQKKKRGATPRITVYVDGPFYPDKTLSPHEAETALHDTVLAVMRKNAKNSTYSPVEYRKAEPAC